jgi:hypothetical protein
MREGKSQATEKLATPGMLKERLFRTSSLDKEEFNEHRSMDEMHAGCRLSDARHLITGHWGREAIL